MVRSHPDRDAHDVELPPVEAADGANTAAPAARRQAGAAPAGELARAEAGERRRGAGAGPSPRRGRTGAIRAHGAEQDGEALAGRHPPPAPGERRRRGRRRCRPPARCPAAPGLAVVVVAGDQPEEAGEEGRCRPRRGGLRSPSDRAGRGPGWRRGRRPATSRRRRRRSSIPAGEQLEVDDERGQVLGGVVVSANRPAVSVSAHTARPTTAADAGGDAAHRRGPGGEQRGRRRRRRGGGRPAGAQRTARSGWWPRTRVRHEQPRPGARSVAAWASTGGDAYRGSRVGMHRMSSGCRCRGQPVASSMRERRSQEVVDEDPPGRPGRRRRPRAPRRRRGHRRRHRRAARGACVSCPASTVTLKAGIERILKDRVEGVTEVVNIGDEQFEGTPLSL